MSSYTPLSTHPDLPQSHKQVETLCHETVELDTRSERSRTRAITYFFGISGDDHNHNGNNGNDLSDASGEDNGDDGEGFHDSDGSDTHNGYDVGELGVRDAD